jgi:hypothetical protein
MSPTPTLAQAARTLEAPQAERRLHRRYPITLRIEYKFPTTGGTKWRGFGKTLNLSTGGVLIEAYGALPADGPIEIAMDWPFLLDGACPLKLVIQGRVVRSNKHLAAAQILRHEFHTARSNRDSADSFRKA